MTGSKSSSQLPWQSAEDLNLGLPDPVKLSHQYSRLAFQLVVIPGDLLKESEDHPWTEDPYIRLMWMVPVELFCFKECLGILVFAFGFVLFYTRCISLCLCGPPCLPDSLEKTGK